jgi:hypothetical protein
MDWIDHVLRQLTELSAARPGQLTIRAGATDEDLARFPSLPEPVARFYRRCDGLVIAHPAFELLPLHELWRFGPLLHFARFDRVEPIAFDTSSLNEAAQWNIVHAPSGHLVTMTLASFLTNKLFAWVRRDRRVWEVDH